MRLGVAPAGLYLTIKLLRYGQSAANVGLVIS
jgi:hypothetical protein